MVCKLMCGAFLLASVLIAGSTQYLVEERVMSDLQQQQYAWEFATVDAQREAENKSYLSFLNVSSMHCGIYHLKSGSRDPQSPHGEDEVYYVQQGAGKFHMDGQEFDVKAGSILFVPAHKKHYFHQIREDLTLLVFFSKAAPQP